MRVLPRLPVSAALGPTGLAGGGLPSGPPRARAFHPAETRTASPGGQRRGLPGSCGYSDSDSEVLNSDGLPMLLKHTALPGKLSASSPVR
jgi:hypothetical protein